MTETYDFTERRRRALTDLPPAEGGASDTLDMELRAINRSAPVFREIAPGQWRWTPDGTREDGLPTGCPVTPLGWDDEGFWFLSARRNVFCLKENAGKGNIDALFAPYGAYLAWAWPRMTGKGDNRRASGNFEAEEVRQDLFAACSDAGAYDPMNRVRGRGAWRSEDGRGLIVHMGDMMLTPGASGRAELRRPGVYEGKAYPVGPALPAPGAHGADWPGIEDFASPGLALMEDYQSWLWMRGDVDARLMLGWTACAMVGGALRWRPYVFASGDQGAGKSTLIEYTQAVLGGKDALLRSEDATEAGVAQTLGLSSVPVLLDELEPEADNTKAEQMVRMARRASSGASRMRGGADGNSTETIVRSCILFAAINMPTMGDQDWARMASLVMSPFPEGAKRKSGLDLVKAAALGRALHRQMIDWFDARRRDAQLGDFDDLTEAVREALKEHGGHNDRGADTFGFLLAGYWAATQTEMPDMAELKALVAGLERDQLAEYDNIMPTWKKCLNLLLDTRPRELERRNAKSVRDILSKFRRKADPYTEGGEDQHEDAADWNWTRDSLKSVGLDLYAPSGDPRDFEHARLFVPNTHPSLNAIFDGSPWRAAAKGAAGGWGSALSGGPREVISKHRTKEARGVLIRLSALMPKPEKGQTDGND